MRIEVIDHPLVAHKLTLLRDESAPSPFFVRAYVDQLVTLLAYEATRDARVEEITIKTPVAETTGVHLSLPTQSWYNSGAGSSRHAGRGWQSCFLPRKSGSWGCSPR